MTISDDQIVEAMLDAWYLCEDWRSMNAQFMRTDMLAALAAAKPLIAQQAREKALDEAWTAIEPFLGGDTADKMRAHHVFALLKETRNV